uniref:Uncharacterized protein n=1 Tax=Parascaris univalens TaxID=6257 RepID=A0A914ZT50_PARUN
MDASKGSIMIVILKKKRKFEKSLRTPSTNVSFVLSYAEIASNCKNKVIKKRITLFSHYEANLKSPLKRKKFGTFTIIVTGMITFTPTTEV